MSTQGAHTVYNTKYIVTKSLGWHTFAIGQGMHCSVGRMNVL